MKKNINRLTQAAYASNSEQWNGDLLAMNDRNFSCTYAYDLNSNMTPFSATAWMCTTPRCPPTFATTG